MAVQQIYFDQISNTGGVAGQVLVANSTAITWGDANNTAFLGGVAAASYVQNTDSRTLSGNLYFTGANNTFSSNLTIQATGELIITAGAGIYANGGLGTAGEVLTSNGSSVYWATSGGAGVNTAAQYIWSNTQTFQNTITFSSNILVGTSANAATLSVGTNFIANTSRVTISAVPLFANGGAGSSGQVLTSNGTTGSPYWATASGGGVTLADETASATTHYPTMSTTSTGSWTAGRVSTTKLYFTPSTGQLNATIFNSLSDAKVKKNIATVENALATINSIRGIRFDWIDNDQPSIGLIAQELEKYLPELVHTNNQGEKSVNYSGIIGVLIEAIKELTTRIEKLEGK
jgi:hypothetical protein